MSALTLFKGELAGISAAFLWAMASIFYQKLGNDLKPLLLNVLKGILASCFLALSLYFFNDWPELIQQNHLILLGISGLIGIAIGDTFFFMALNRIGVRQLLLLETLSPPLAALFALLAFGIYLQGYQWLAIIITLSGVAWVISEQNPEQPHRFHCSGIFYGFMAALCQAIGAVLAHVAMNDAQMSSLFSAFIRISVATALLLPWLYLTKGRNTSFLTKKIWRYLLPAAFIGTFLCIWLQQTALRFTSPAIAQTLLALSPLFVLPLLKMHGEIVSNRAILGAFIAVVGVSLLFVFATPVSG